MKQASLTLDYGTRPRFPMLRKWLRLTIWATIFCAAIIAASLGWLWWGWWSEQGAIKKIGEHDGGAILTKSLHAPVISHLLPNRWTWLLDRANDALFSKSTSDPDLADLELLPGLKAVHLEYAQVTDAGLVHLAAVKELEVLNLSHTKVTDAGLAHLSGLTNLRSLGLNYTQLTDAGLLHLKELKQLTYLGLINTRITNAGIAELRKALPGCYIDAGRIPD